jgi:hypothetical protein
MKRDETWQVPDAVHEELVNWTRWCWSGEWPHPLPATQCGSLESQYRAPPDWNPDDMPEAPHIRPNDRHARKVQVVYDDLAGPERAVLKAEYPGRHTSGRNHGKHVAARRMGLTVDSYDLLLQSAVRRVEEAFEVRV